MSYELENALFQWEEGHRRLEDLRDDPARYGRVGRVIGAIQDELRRRIGPTFMASDLAELYGSGTDWALQVAIDADPDDASSWDSQTVTDAAFYLYLRSARDFAGGRRLELDESR